MTIKDIILSEVKNETANTKRLLERIQDEHLSWKPHEKSMSLGQLAAHVVELHGWLGLVVGKDKFDFHTDYQRIEVESVDQLNGILDAGLEKNMQILDTQEDVDWSKEWVLAAGDAVISKNSKISAIRYIVQNHLIHHRGQLTVYLRLLNVPVPGLYGPSADDAKA